MDAAEKDISEKELQDTLDFCTQAYSEPCLPEERAKVLSHVGDVAIHDAVKMVRDEDHPDRTLIDGLDEQSYKVFKAITARRVLRTEEINNITTSDQFGFRMRMERGELGLQRAN